MSYGPQTGLDKTGKSRLGTSVWNGGAADSAKQHQKCYVRFFLLPTLPQFNFLHRFLDTFPVMISFLAASMWSWKSLIAADIVSSSVLATTIFFQKRFAFLANIIARSADLYMGQPDTLYLHERSSGSVYMWLITGLQVPLVNCFFRVWCWKIYWWNPVTSSWSFGLCNAEFHCLALYNVYSIFYFFKF